MEKNKKTEEIKENTAAETDAFESEEDRNLTILKTRPTTPRSFFRSRPRSTLILTRNRPTTN